MIEFSKNRFKFHLTRKIFFLDYCEFKKLSTQAYRAQQNDHMEVCGLVCINRKKRLKIFFLKNRSVESYHYSIYDRDINLFQKRTGAHYKILGTFHSHPIGLAYPGTGDIKRAFHNNIEFIYDVCGDDLKMWYRFKFNANFEVREIPLLIKNKINPPLFLD